jgi:cell division protein ZapE
MSAISEGYRRRLGNGELERDDAQAELAKRLDELATELASYGRSSGLLPRMFGKSPSPPKGLYIWGSVGRGKTMLMDLFFEETAFEPKRRTHFHAFMADVHDRIGRARAEVPGDPIPHVAREIAEQARLLCFDEMHVTDIADAMILGRLFEALFAAGTVVVTTSNSPPDGLYKNGLNRQLFLPFIALIERHMDVVELSAQKDFRLEKLSGRQLYFCPADGAARAELDAHWQRLTGIAKGKPQTLEVLGRHVKVPQAAMGVARFDFRDLCDVPLAANDYLALTRAFHTILIDDIPVLTPDRRDVARRFINLIDALYDARICLIASAEAEPAALYPAGHGADLFERTASRLTEMRSEAYLASRHASPAP